MADRGTRLGREAENGQNLNEQSVGVMEFELRNVRVRPMDKAWALVGRCEEAVKSPNICIRDMEHKS